MHATMLMRHGAGVSDVGLVFFVLRNCTSLTHGWLPPVPVMTQRQYCASASNPPNTCNPPKLVRLLMSVAFGTASHGPAGLPAVCKLNFETSQPPRPSFHTSSAKPSMPVMLPKSKITQ
jgi:hypothetical protein